MEYLINSPVSIEDIDFNHVNDNLPRYGNDFDYEGQESIWCVYVHINKINNKKYIGVSSNLKTRWMKTGYAYRGCKAFYGDIKKYGFDGFEHIVLMNGLTQSMASEIEKQLIIKLDSHISHNHGYNIAEGGIQKVQANYSVLYKSVYMYDLQGIFIQKFDSLSQAEYLVNNNKRGKQISNAINSGNGFAYGFLWSFEYFESLNPYLPPRHKKYRDEYHKPTDILYGPILQISFNGDVIKEYKDIYYVSDRKTFTRNVLDCCKHARNAPSYQGYFWIFKSNYSKETIDQLILERQEMLKNSNNKKHVDYCSPVIQYDSNGQFVQKFNSLRDINIPGFNIEPIVQALLGKSKTSYNFQWRYEYQEAPGKINPCTASCKKIMRICIETGEKKTYVSLKEACIDINIKNGKKITKCTRGIIESAYGYIWRYLDDNGNIIEPEIEGVD